MKDSQRGLLTLFAAAAAVGVYLEVKRPRSEATAPVGSVPTPSASAAVAAAPAPKAASRERIRSGLARLEGAVRAGATDAAQPWALAHGLIALGPELGASDGRSAVDVIGSFAEKQRADGVVLFRFPRRKADSIVEPHDDLLVKTLLEIGVPLERRLVTADGSSVTVERLASDVARRARMPTDDPSWHHAAWTLSALVERARRGAPAVKTLSLRELTAAALTRLEQDHTVVTTYAGDPKAAFDVGSPLRRAKEDKSGIYGHSCGGLHLVQAVLAGVAADPTPELSSRVRRQLGVLLFRYEAEREAYAKLLSEHPEHGLILRTQQVKFFGHLVETLTLAQDLGSYDAASEGGRRIEQTMLLAAGDLLDTFDALEQGGVYQRLSEIRRDREQTYLDLIGDGCHAIRGLRRLLSGRTP